MSGSLPAAALVCLVVWAMGNDGPTAVLLLLALVPVGVYTTAAARTLIAARAAETEVRRPYRFAGQPWQG